MRLSGLNRHLTNMKQKGDSEMKKLISLLLMVSLVVTLGLTGCGTSTERSGSATTDETASGTTSNDSTDTAEASEEKTVIGVALPWLGTQNWAEADEMFKTRLEAFGYEAIVQHADNKVTTQQQQIESMIQNGAEVIVVGPVDGSQLGAVLEEAAAAGVKIIGYDRLIENTDAIDGVVQFDSIATGVLQGEMLLQGLAEKGEGPYNIELFGGGPADPNAPNFFKGAMQVLQPKIDDGTLVVVSGQLDFTQAATLGWDNAKAQARMDSILSGFYSEIEIDGVLCPNDGIARAVITSAEQAGQPMPITSGLDAENTTVEWIWQDKQYSTIAKPTDTLVTQTLMIIQEIVAGNAMPEPNYTTNNGVKDVNIYALAPLGVTKDNIKEAFANDQGRLDLLK